MRKGETMANYYHRVTVDGMTIEDGFQTLAELQDHIEHVSVGDLVQTRVDMDRAAKTFCDESGKPIDVSK